MLMISIDVASPPPPVASPLVALPPSARLPRLDTSPALASLSLLSESPIPASPPLAYLLASADSMATPSRLRLLSNSRQHDS